LWKVIWLVATAAGLVLVAAWFGTALQSIAWQDTGNRTANAWVAARVLQEFWSSHSRELLLLLGLLCLFSAVGWRFLEALFHSRIVGQFKTKLFFASGLGKSLALFAIAIVLLPVAGAGGLTIAVALFIVTVVLLTVLDTLIRTDAMELIGSDLLG